jgi:hypothetical protein
VIRDERATTQTDPFQANPEGRWALWPIFCVARCSRGDLSMLVARRLENRPNRRRRYASHL